MTTNEKQTEYAGWLKPMSAEERTLLAMLRKTPDFTAQKLDKIYRKLYYKSYYKIILMIIRIKICSNKVIIYFFL